ncbi:MAG: hypothetical protein U1E18_15610 [Brevundimonas sp.]|uniref:hypothetical protein n=1 Tax=Brevundimonas sp. TaxID=1871086 RepID=UPI002ABC8548|nr:hypothetical protein [Brevundimonas sp.]MDZ4111010.1 hypothetical protein [Brevundimonas sp.]
MLIAGRAVVLAGKRVAGLQEAEVMDVRLLVTLPRVEILGSSPPGTLWSPNLWRSRW